MAEESSARAAQILKRRGFEEALALLGGIVAWQQHGFPVEGSEVGVEIEAD